MSHQIREEDNGKDNNEIDDIIKSRTYSVRWIDKVTWAFIAFLVSSLAFFAIHWFGTIERAIIFNDNKFRDVLKESKDYTNAVMTQHIKEMVPYWNNFNEVKKTVNDTHDEVERITTWMEYKQGMPMKGDKKNK